MDITSGSGGGDEDRIYVIYKDKTTGKTAACDSINIVCSDSASFSLLPRYIDSRRWQNELRIYNERSQSPISGTVTFISPDFLAERVGTVRFENIPPYGSKTIRTSIPEDMFKDKITASAIVELDSGERFEIANDYYCSGLARCENPPEIDGVLSPDEWQTFAPLELKYAQQVQMMTDWGGGDDLSGSIYCMWDNDYFYIGAEVTDNLLGDSDAEDRVWACDSIQFAFAEDDRNSSGRTEYGIGLIDGETSVERYAYIPVDTDITGITDDMDLEGIEAAVTRSGNKTYYEAKFPWKQIYGSDGGIGLKKFVRFSLLINDNDQEGRRGWLEYCPGIGYTKDASQFVEFPVLKN